MTNKTHLDQLNAEVTEAIFVAERLDNNPILKCLGPLYQDYLQLRIKAWERVKQAEDALHRMCLAKNLETEYEVARLGSEQAQETIKDLRKEAAYLGADYYDCEDSEELRHESAEEAIRDFIDNCSSYGEQQGLRELFQEQAPIEVTAHVRKAINPKDFRGWAESMVEDLECSFGEEYGPPDDPPFEERVKETLVFDITSAIAKACGATRVWQCEPVATREYSEEELLEMFKQDIEEEEAEEKV